MTRDEREAELIEIMNAPGGRDRIAQILQRHEKPTGFGRLPSGKGSIQTILDYEYPKKPSDEDSART